MIGKSHSTSYPQYFQGLIDEVRGVERKPSTRELHALDAPDGERQHEGSVEVLMDRHRMISSGNGNNGTLNGGATYSTDVPGGQPSNYQSILFEWFYRLRRSAHSASLNITGSAITLEAWVKMPVTNTVSYQIILEKAPAFGTEGGYDLCITDQGKARVDIYYGAYYLGLIGNTVLSANTWHHVAGVYNGQSTQGLCRRSAG